VLFSFYPRITDVRKEPAVFSKVLWTAKFVIKWRHRFLIMATQFGALVAPELAFAQAPFFMAVGDASGDRVEEVSGDGSVVIGWKQGFSGNPDQAFRWTSSGGRVVLGGATRRAFDISHDASVITGRADFGSGTETFKWTSAGGATSLGDLLGGGFGGGILSGVSGDGLIVVGESSSTLGTEAFRWDLTTGIVGLGDLAGGQFNSQARAASYDGSVIVGGSASTLGSLEAFRWTSSGGMVGLGSLTGSTVPGTTFASVAHDVSANGSVLVGWSRSTNTTFLEAFRWTSPTGMVGLGFLAGDRVSGAHAVSSDGSIIVGSSRPTDSSVTNRAFIWDATNGMRDLRTVLTTEYGLNVNGWELGLATGVSADGRTIVGQGSNPQGNSASWIAYLGPAPVPEPLTSTLAVIGVLSLVSFGRFRTQTQR
jgi:probable HAF family extracellular repeat protein